MFVRHKQINSGNLPVIQKDFVHPKFHEQQSVHVFKIIVNNAISGFSPDDAIRL